MEFKDEILNGNKILYDICDSNGNVLQSNIELKLKNTIVQAGTPINKALFDDFKNSIFFENSVFGTYTALPDVTAPEVSETYNTATKIIDIGFRPPLLIIYKPKEAPIIIDSNYNISYGDLQIRTSTTIRLPTFRLVDNGIQLYHYCSYYEGISGNRYSGRLLDYSINSSGTYNYIAWR